MRLGGGIIRDIIFLFFSFEVFGGVFVSSIFNCVSNTVLSGSNDKDVFFNIHGKNVKINCGKGDDEVCSYFSNVVTVNGEAGNDYIKTIGCNYGLISGGKGNDSIENSKTGFKINVSEYGGFYKTISGDEGDDYIENYGHHSLIYGGTGYDRIYNYSPYVTIYGGNGNDTIENIEKSVISDGISGISGIKSVVYGGKGNEYISNSAHEVTISGGKGNDYISENGDRYYSKNLIQYKSGDGNDTIVGFNSSDTLQITKGSYKVTTKGNDVIVKVGKGKIILKYAKGIEISIQDSKGKVTTKTYGSSSSQTAELFAENNFVTVDNLSEITKNNLTPTALEKITTQNFENLTSENNFVTYSEK